MDCLDNCAASVCKVLKRFHNGGCSETVKTGCRLVEENEAWVGDDFDSDRATLSLATRDALDECAPDFCALALG